MNSISGAQKDILIEVEHVEAHRIEMEKHQMSLLEKFIIGSNDKAEMSW